MVSQTSGLETKAGNRDEIPMVVAIQFNTPVGCHDCLAESKGARPSNTAVMRFVLRCRNVP